MSSSAPCISCQNRHVGCHSSCVDYKQWCDSNAKVKKEASKNKKYTASPNARTTHVPFVLKRR